MKAKAKKLPRRRATMVEVLIRVERLVTLMECMTRIAERLENRVSNLEEKVRGGR